VQACVCDDSKKYDERKIYLGYQLTPKRVIELGEKTRLRHLYVIGKTGSAKSTFLKTSFCKILRTGQGCV